MAVEDRARAPPVISAPFQSMPVSQAMIPPESVEISTCTLPRPNTVAFIANSREMENSRPIINSRKTTPISASVWMVSLSGSQPSA